MPQIARWLPVTVGVLALGMCLFWLFSRLNNPLLGKWIYVSGDTALDPTDTDAIGERGIEFLPGSRFATFGYKVNGHIVNTYGTYTLTSGNRVKLETVGFHTVLDGTNADVKLDRMPRELNKPRYLIFSPALQDLEEEDAITMPAQFMRTGQHKR